jgi:integrase
MKLSQQNAARQTLPAGKTDAIFFDDDIGGFGLRIRAGGRRSWIFQYTIGKQDRRMTFGRFPAMSAHQAREQASRLHAQVKLGADPAGAKSESQARSGETFKVCINQYLALRRGTVRISTFGEIERHLARNLAPLHGLHIAKLDRRGIALELTRLSAQIGPVQANRTRASLSKFLNWCAGQGLIDANPAAFTNKNPEKPRGRVLKDDELRLIWRALEDGDFGDIVKLLILTGCRREEIAQLRWSEVDLERGIISLPPDRTKNHRPHTVPLSGTARAIIEGRVSNGRPLVFGRGLGGFSGWTHSKRRLGELVKIPHWVIHDLRRSTATGMADLGIQPHVIEAALNHVSGAKAGVAGIYNHSTYEVEKRTALDRWAEHVGSLAENKPSNVTPMRIA